MVGWPNGAPGRPGAHPSLRAGIAIGVLPAKLCACPVGHLGDHVLANPVGLCAKRVWARHHFQLLYPDVWMNTRVTSGSICVCVACVHDQGTQIMTGVQDISARLGFRARVHLSQGLETVRWSVAYPGRS
mgnify:CR=1 FL=1